jgi:hypothetical protein
MSRATEGFSASTAVLVDNMNIHCKSRLILDGATPRCGPRRGSDEYHLYAWQDAPLAFEAASIKTAKPVSGRVWMTVYSWRGCNNPHSGLLRCNAATLQALLMRAFDVQAYQIQGPPWIQSDEFEVVARIPKGGTRHQVRSMSQAFLAERFAVKLQSGVPVARSRGPHRLSPYTEAVLPRLCAGGGWKFVEL